MKTFFTSMFEDATGGTSSTRVIMILVISTVLTVWSYTSIQSGDIKEIPQSVLTLALGTGALKVGQRMFGENDTAPVKDEETK